MFEVIIETIFSISLFINAILFVPQIIQLYKIKNSKSFSLTTFVGFNLIQLSILLHAFLHKDYLLAIGTGLSLITCGIIVFMILFYRRKF